MANWGTGDVEKVKEHLANLRQQYKDKFSLKALRLKSGGIHKGDEEIRKERLLLYNTGKLDNLHRPYWPMPSKRLTPGSKEAKPNPYDLVLSHDDFFDAHEREMSRPYQRDLFPTRRRGGEEFDDTEKVVQETEAEIAKKRKKYDFSKLDAFLAEQKSLLTFDALQQFMSHELHEGDRIEAVKEIVYPNEGLVIPVGRKGVVRKVKLDHREEFAAVEWDHTTGMRAIEMRSKYYMKQPLEVVFGFADAPSTIQWPTSACMQNYEDVNCTWQYRPKGEQSISGIQHPDSEPVRLRQGYKANTFALESCVSPKMMLALVPTGNAGAGGVKDPRRLRLVDYTEKDDIDRNCCFRPKRVGERSLRIECCAERNQFLMLKLPSDPRVCAPFVHIHTYSMQELFAKNSQFTICITTKEIPKYARTEFDVVKLNPTWVMQQQQAVEGAKNERVTFVTAYKVGESALGVKWAPNVGKCRLWLQFRNQKDPNAVNSQWVLAATECGGASYPCAAVLDTRITNGYEGHFDQCRVAVAPLARMHRFADILLGNFYKANAQASQWTHLPDSSVWKRPLSTVRRNYWEEDEDEDDEVVDAAAVAGELQNGSGTSPDLQQLLDGGQSQLTGPPSGILPPVPEEAGAGSTLGLGTPGSGGKSIPITVTNAHGDSVEGQL